MATILLGSVELDIQLVTGEQKDILDFTIADLLTAKISVKHPRFRRTPTDSPIKLVTVKEISDEDVLVSLKAIGLTLHTISMVSKKVLGITTSRDEIPKKFSLINTKAQKWLDTAFDFPLIGIFITKLTIPRINPQTAIIGLDENHCYRVLAFEPSSVEGALEKVKERGVNLKKLKFVMLTKPAGEIENFKKLFPNAALLRSWTDYRDKAPEELRPEWDEAMLTSDKDFAEDFIKDQQAPKELLNYYNFDPSIWRALRTASIFDKLERDIRSIIARPHVRNQKQSQALIIWNLLRLQYHWLRLPVDSDSMQHLKYAKVTFNEME